MTLGMGNKEAFSFILNVALRKSLNEMHVCVSILSPVIIETQGVHGLQKKTANRRNINQTYGMITK